MNQQWHDKNPFPDIGTETEKDQWRQKHRSNCNCSKMMLPYRKTSREK